MATVEAAAGDGRWRMISRTGEYALRVVLDFAGRAPGEWNSAGDTAARLGIPDRYLARVLNALARAGTLESTRGARGGFRLASSPGALTLAAVVSPFDAVGHPPSCLLREQRCGVGEPCLAHEQWHGVAGEVRTFFQTTTIADLLGEGAPPDPG